MTWNFYPTNALLVVALLTITVLLSYVLTEDQRGVWAQRWSAAMVLTLVEETQRIKSLEIEVDHLAQQAQQVAVQIDLTERLLSDLH